MSKLKITIEKKEEVKTCKHEVGGVYAYEAACDAAYYLVVMFGNSYYLLNLTTNDMVNVSYTSLKNMDDECPNDIPVDAELIIREVQ